MLASVLTQGDELGPGLNLMIWGSLSACHVMGRELEGGVLLNEPME